MLAVAGRLPPDDGEWAYEFKWDGMRVLVWVDGGRLRLVSRNGNDVTGSFPELRGPSARRSAPTRPSSTGSWWSSGQDGRPSFSQLQHRIHAGSPAAVRRSAAEPPGQPGHLRPAPSGRRLPARPDYDDRRAGPRGAATSGPRAGRSPRRSPTSTGSRILASAVDAGHGGGGGQTALEPLPAGRRSRDWIKVKNQRTQEVVIGGFTEGKGSRRADFGALLLGLPSTGSPEADLRGQGGDRVHRRGPGRAAR